ADASMALNRGTTATNQASTSMGFRTISDNLGMLAIGVNNAAGIGDPTADQYYYADGQYTGAPAGVAFVIGNGDINTSALQRGDNPSNAFVVNYDGSATLSGDLTINSDARLKSNIISLGSTLAKLLMIDGKSYTMKTNESESKIGLLAQDVQKAFPELVKTTNDSNQTLSVNYQGLIPVLINAIKEQQKQIDELKNKLK
ncbi:tail fiber domain-containing protein, partial [Flavobacteriaceae bacterium]|nr:tail fiber domain-containing protein [Flavobacteriaceae bacterium]